MIEMRDVSGEREERAHGFAEVISRCRVLHGGIPSETD
jgi:hypothetical protein